MDAVEWQRVAGQAAAALNAEIDALEARFWPVTPGTSFRDFWQRIDGLKERVRTAPAIMLDDKLALQHRLAELCKRARQDQKLAQQRAAADRHELLNRIGEAREEVGDARS